MAGVEVKPFLIGFVILLLYLAALGWCGSLDYEDESSNLAYWTGQGIEIARW